jgi:diguanylate cyclase (GGDEF)-like protein
VESVLSDLLGDPAVEGIVVNSRDVTDRKRAERLEADRKRVLEMVAEGAGATEILKQLIVLIERQRPGIHAAILLARKQLLSVDAASEALREVAPGLKAPFGVLGGCCGRAAQQRKTVVSNDVLTDPIWGGKSELPQRLDLGRAVAIPMLSASGEVLGVVVIFGDKSSPLTSADWELFDTAARLASIAIERTRLSEQLAHQARHDPLTGLANRGYLNEHLKTVLRRAEHAGTEAALLFIDLDRFKQINDTLGHHTGDLLLQRIGARMEGRLRRTDFLARVGGDEFAAVLTLRDPADAALVARKLLDALRIPFQVQGREFVVTASIGVSWFPRDGRDAATLLGNADRAMYRAKHLGKNAVEFFTADLGDISTKHAQIENQLRNAVERCEFKLHYQPQAEMDGSLAGFEALLAWKHPELGLVPPSEFIPIAEDSGQIITVGSWVLEQACRDAASWTLPLVLSVNVSALQFARADFVEVVAAAIADSRLPPGRLELELTESAIMRHVDAGAKRMGQLRELGVRISIDDFGTGYSSLSYLRKLPLDTLKVDQSFTAEVDAPGGTLPLIQTVVTLAEGLGLSVVVEGVETLRQLELLRQTGCKRAQGHLFGAPVPADGVAALIARRNLLPDAFPRNSPVTPSL